MLFRGKKGFANEQIAKRMTNLILLAAATLAMLAFSGWVLSDDAFFKNYYSRDTALLVDTMQDLPGDSWVNYELKEEFSAPGVSVEISGNLDIIFTPGKVHLSTSKARDSDSAKGDLGFIFGVNEKREYFDNETRINNAKDIIIEKQDDRLSARGTT